LKVLAKDSKSWSTMLLSIFILNVVFYSTFFRVRHIVSIVSIVVKTKIFVFKDNLCFLKTIFIKTNLVVLNDNRDYRDNALVAVFSLPPHLKHCLYCLYCR